jgi:hypothetical protein
MVPDVRAAVDVVRSRHKPLALYLFSSRFVQPVVGFGPSLKRLSPSHAGRPPYTAMTKLPPIQRPHVRGVRVALGTGYNRVEGNRRQRARSLTRNPSKGSQAVRYASTASFLTSVCYIPQPRDAAACASQHQRRRRHDQRHAVARGAPPPSVRRSGRERHGRLPWAAHNRQLPGDNSRVSRTCLCAHLSTFVRHPLACVLTRAVGSLYTGFETTCTAGARMRWKIDNVGLLQRAWINWGSPSCTALGAPAKASHHYWSTNVSVPVRFLLLALSPAPARAVLCHPVPSPARPIRTH